MVKKLTTDQFQEFVVKQFEVLNDRFDSVEQKIEGLQEDVQEIKDVLEPLTKAVDKDAITLIDHHLRIARIEKGLVV